jgi:hypothetical protein
MTSEPILASIDVLTYPAINRMLYRLVLENLLLYN